MKITRYIFPFLLLLAFPRSINAETEPLCYWQVSDGTKVDLSILCGSYEHNTVNPNSIINTTNSSTDNFRRSILKRDYLTNEKAVSLGKGFASRYASLYCGEREAGLSHERAKDYANSKIDPQMTSMLLNYENGVDLFDIVDMGQLMFEYPRIMCPNVF